MEVEIERADPHSELGYLRREDAHKGRSEVQRALNRIGQTYIDHRQRNFELMKELDPNIIDVGQGTVSLKILGRQIDFHLPSNTFYSHAKQTFGYGIDNQVKAIQAYLKERESKCSGC